MRSSRRPTSPAPRARSTSRTCGSTSPGSARRSSCSRCGCRFRARPFTVPTRPRGRRRSWKATRPRSRCSAGRRCSTSATTTSRLRVSRVLFGRTRTESARWVAFRSHHGFESFYCHPGVEGAHEKGGVEGEGGRFRRNHLVPVPKVETMAELNELLIGYDLADDARRISNRTMSVGQHFAFEASLLRPLPSEVFQTGLVLTPRVDRYSRVTVRQCFYSVPTRLIGHQVRAVLHASELVLFSGRTEVARHERATVRGSQTLVLDHYLEVLVRKPGALRGATALVQARAAGTFTSAHEAFWAAARKAHGDAGGTRALVEVLLLHRRHTHVDVVAGITAALGVGTVSPDVVALETRKHAHQQAAAVDQVVVSLEARRLADLTDQLPLDLRPPPSVAAYDSLLTGTRHA